MVQPFHEPLVAWADDTSVSRDSSAACLHLGSRATSMPVSMVLMPSFSGTDLPFKLLWAPARKAGVPRVLAKKTLRTDLFVLQPGTKEPLMAMDLKSGGGQPTNRL